MVFCLTNVPAPSSGKAGGLIKSSSSPRLSERCEDLVWKFKAGLTNDRSLVENVKKVREKNLLDISWSLDGCKALSQNREIRIGTLERIACEGVK